MIVEFLLGFGGLGLAYTGCGAGVSGAGDADFCVGEEREGSRQGGWCQEG